MLLEFASEDPSHPLNGKRFHSVDLEFSNSRDYPEFDAPGVFLFRHAGIPFSVLKLEGTRMTSLGFLNSVPLFDYTDEEVLAHFYEQRELHAIGI